MSIQACEVACCAPLARAPLTADWAGDLGRMFKALGDPVRLRLLSMIASHGGGEACVCDLSAGFDLTQPTISHHLRVLREAGLIDCERRGTWVYYRVVASALAQLSAVLGTAEAGTPPTTPISCAAPTPVPRGLDPSTRRHEGNTMTTIEVFDPAMCCPTGVCGPSVEPDLARFESDLRWAGAQGAAVTRFNLAQQPGEFAARPIVASILQSGGEEALPVTLVDGRLRWSGSYPSRAELGAAVGVEPAGSGCCAPAEQDSPGCC